MIASGTAGTARAGRPAVVLGAAALAFGLVVTAYSWLVESRLLRRHALRVALPDLPRRLEGLRLAFLTDFHLSKRGPTEALTRRAIRAARDWQAELVLLGGDYFDEGRFYQAEAFDELRAFPLVCAVLGNHDYRQGEAIAGRIVAFLQRYGVTVLRNEALEVQLRGETLRVLGLDDPYTGRASLPVFPVGTRPPTVLLAHAPLLIDELPVGSVQLILSGHTHSGQIRLSPLSRLTPLDAAWYLDRSRGRKPSRLQRGTHWERGALLHISAGIGTTTLPLRFLAPPEVVLIKLTADAVNPARPCDDPARYLQRLAYSVVHERPHRDARRIRGANDSHPGHRRGRWHPGHRSLRERPTS
jgi:predicted MPP superfamily phosphohydrolase